MISISATAFGERGGRTNFLLNCSVSNNAVKGSGLKTALALGRVLLQLTGYHIFPPGNTRSLTAINLTG